MVTKRRNLGWKAWSKKQNPKPTASLQLHTSVMGRLQRQAGPGTQFEHREGLQADSNHT